MGAGAEEVEGVGKVFTGAVVGVVGVTVVSSWRSSEMIMVGRPLSLRRRFST